ncbi:MAG: VanW family protein [Tepidiformaceae bacterium]
MTAREYARRLVPFETRVRIALLRRRARDARARLRFATGRAPAHRFPFEWARYQRPFIDYPGQEQLGVAKRRNQALLASALDGVVVASGEVFSLWRIAPRPSAARGYAPAAALRRGELVTDIGGAICLLSTALYNAALLAGLEVLERHCHSVDSYGQARYFELGRDATIEYGYLDLRFRNPHPTTVQFSVATTQSAVTAAVRAALPAPGRVELVVTPAELVTIPGWGPGLRVRTIRRSHNPDAVASVEDLGFSVYRSVPGVAAEPIRIG